MAISRALLRLLHVLHLEEEQARLALENILAELHHLEKALMSTEERKQLGRTMVAESAQSGDLLDRIAGLEESRLAASAAEFLTQAVDTVHAHVVESREEFLSVRIEHRQVETLIQEAEEQEELVSAHRAQQELDEWHRTRARDK